jgi:hypothetical protein
LGPTYDPNIDTNDDEAARWLLELIDSSKDRLTLVRMSAAIDEEHLNYLEDRFREVYKLAKAERPNLCATSYHAACRGSHRPGDFLRSPLA